MATKTSATNRRVAELVTGIRDKKLLPNPRFQRRLVWTAKHKAEFVRTVLLGLPFPEIFVSQAEVDVESGDALEWLVDGQQRLTTLSLYFTGDLQMNYQLFDLQPYENLTQDEKTEFLQYEVAVRDLGKLEESEIVTIFSRINSTGYSLNAMEVNNARYDGPLKQFAEAIPAWDTFEDHRVFTALDTKRMGDIKYCLTLLITMMSGYFHRETEHETYLQKYNDDFPQQEELEVRLRRSLDALVSRQYDARSRAWRKADLFTLLSEIDALYEEGVEPDLDALDAFLAEVDRIAEATRTGSGQIRADSTLLAYIDASIQGVNDRGSRQRRGEILREVLQP